MKKSFFFILLAAMLLTMLLSAYTAVETRDMAAVNGGELCIDETGNRRCLDFQMFRRGYKSKVM